MLIRDVCPPCKSPQYKEHGHIHHGKQHHHGHGCGRQVVQCCEHYRIAEDKRGRIERLRMEWLLRFLAQCFAALPKHLHVQPVSCTRDVLIQRLEGEADALASCVQKQAHKQWVWIALDATTRQIMACHVGDRSHTSAEHLWTKIPPPPAGRQHATFDTDQYVVYEKVIPAAQHQAISKLARKTNHIEWFNSKYSVNPFQ